MLNPLLVPGLEPEQIKHAARPAAWPSDHQLIRVAGRDAVERVAHEKMDQHFGNTERHGDAAERMPESIENAGCQLQPTK